MFAEIVGFSKREVKMLSMLPLCMRYDLKSLSEVQFKSDIIILNLPKFFLERIQQ